MKYLNIGRVVSVRTPDEKKLDWGLGCVINFKKEKNHKKQKDQTENTLYIADILVYIKKKQEGDQPQPTPFND